MHKMDIEYWHVVTKTSKYHTWICTKWKDRNWRTN